MVAFKLARNVSLNAFSSLTLHYCVESLTCFFHPSEVIDKVVRAIDAECARHKGLPPLVQLMNRQRTADPHLGPVQDLSTTYRENFTASSASLASASPSRATTSATSASRPGNDGGMAGQGNNTFGQAGNTFTEGANVAAGDVAYKQQPPDFGFHRPTQQLGAHLNKSAKVLYAGTTKMTHHVPGYRGHIPQNLRNERKVQHCGGAIAHEQYNHLVLSQRGMGCVLNYTGYVPRETFFPRTERMTSCDPRTSNGAAYGPVKLLL